MPTIAPKPPLPDMTGDLKPALPDMTGLLKPADVGIQQAAQDTDLGGKPGAEQPLPVTGPETTGVPEKTIQERAGQQQEKAEGPSDPEGGWAGFLEDPVTQAALMTIAPGEGLYTRAVHGLYGAATAPEWATAGVAAEKLAKKIAPNNPGVQAAISNGVLLGAPILGSHYLSRLAARRPFVQPMEEAEGTAEAIENREPAMDSELARIKGGQPRRTPYVKPEAAESIAKPEEAPVESESSDLTRSPTSGDSPDKGAAPGTAAPPQPIDELRQAAEKKDPVAARGALATELSRAPAADTFEVPVNQIDTDPDRLQYKLGYGKEGAGLALTKAKKYNRALGGVVTLMENPDKPGRFLIVNGHQRLDLARRSGEDSMRAQVLPKGTTFEQARAVGALINIAEERGTSVDAAKFMRDMKAMPEQMQREGIDLTSGMMQNATALSQLDDGLFRDVTTGTMRPARGVVIGRELGDDKPGQEAIAKALKTYEKKGQTITDKQLEDMIRNEKIWGSLRGTETETDLFGTRELKKSYAPDAAKLVGYVRDKLQEDKRLFGTAAEKQARLKAGGTAVGVEQARDISEGAGMRSAALDARGPNFRDVVAKYAPELAQASDKDKPKILKKAYDDAFEALAKDWGSQKELAGVAPAGGAEAEAVKGGAAPSSEAAPATETPKPEEEPAEPAKVEGGPEYQAAYDKITKATQEFNAAQEAYRSRKIGDDEFLAARKKYDAAEADFDKARGEAPPEEGPNAEELEKAGQGSIFGERRGAQAAADYAAEQEERAAREAGRPPDKDPVDFYAGIPVTQLAKKLEPLFGQVRNAFRETFRPEDISRASEDAYYSVNEKLERVNAERAWMSEAFHRNLFNAFKPMSPTQQAAIVSAYERDEFNAIPQAMQPFFRAMKPITDYMHDNLVRVRAGGQQGLYNSQVGFIDNYWRHLWKDDPAKVQQAYGTALARLKQPGGFLKQRKFLTIEDGIKAGLTPAYENMADMQLAGMIQQAKYVAGQDVFQEGKNQGWVRAFKSPRDLPQGWEQIPDPISKILQFSPTEKGMIDRGFWAAPKEWNRVIDRALHPSAMGPLTKGVYNIKNRVAGIKVGFSLFHPLLTSSATMIQDAGRSISAGMEALARGDFTNAAFHLAAAPLKGLNVVQPFMDRASGEAAINKMKQGIFADPEVKMMLDSGFTPGTRIAGEVATEALSGAMKIPTALQKKLEFVMTKWVAPLKAGQFIRLMNENIQNAVERGQPLSGMALKRMGADTAAHSDWLLGQVGAHRLLMSTFMRDATRLGINFPAWQFGTAKIIGGAARGAAKLATGGAMDTQAKLALQYAAGLAVMAPVYGTIASLLTTGKPPTSLGDSYLKAADSMPIYILRDVVSAAGHIAGEGYKTGLTRYALGKVSWPLITAGEIFWANRDPTNWQQIRYPSQSVPKQTEQTLKALAKQGMPYSVLTGAEQHAREVAQGDTSSEAAKWAKVAIKGSFGVRPPPPALERSSTQNFINQNRMQIARSAATPEEGQRWQAKYEVVSQVRQGNYEGALQAFNTAVQKGILNRDVDAKSIATMMKEGPLGSAMQTAGLPMVMQFWEHAQSSHDTADQKEIEKYFIKKMNAGAWQKLAPNEQQALKAQRDRIIEAIIAERQKDAAATP